MAHFCINPLMLYKEMNETILRKIGINLSYEKILELLQNTESIEYFKRNEKYPIRIEATEAEYIYRDILKSLGYDIDFNHYNLISNSIKEFSDSQFEEISYSILERFIVAIKNVDSKIFNVIAEEFIDSCFYDYGRIGFAIAFSVINHFMKMIKYSFSSKEKIIPYSYTVKLEDLSKPLIDSEVINDFSFDNRFITYLNANFKKIDTIHWRNFELLVGQFFKDSGYSVIINKGTKDGGIDLKITDEHGIKTYIQCKRYNKNVGISVVKELTATVEHNKDGVENGIIVCTHKVSANAKEFVNEYGLKITYKEKNDIQKYLFEESFKA